MKKAYLTIAAFTLALLSAFSAQAAEGVQAMGSGVRSLIVRESLVDHVKLQSISAEKKIEIEAPVMNGGKRKDSTSASIRKQTGDPQRSGPEREASVERTTTVAKKQDSPIENKFGIYNSIKEAVLDFFKPSRKQSPAKVDISRLQKDGRTEYSAKKRASAEQVK